MGNDRQPARAAAEAEVDRQQLIEETVEDRGADWHHEFKPGTTGCHELLDRTALVADLIERSIVEHPSCFHNPEWYKLARQAADALHELYQRVGAEHLEVETKPMK